MYNIFLHEPELDFVLTKDSIVYNRDYSSYEVFNIDLTSSLYSTIGVAIPTGVTMNNIALTGYDNGLLNRYILPEFFGDVVTHNAYSYTFTNSAYIHNYNSVDLLDLNRTLLIEAKLPVVQNYGNYNFIYLDNGSSY
jgi:hypothetical protein